jgi:hypothetical protein
MPTPKNMFNTENLVKLTVLAVFCYNIMNGIFDIKQDIALIKQASIYKNDQLQYQIDELKEGKRDTDKHIAYNQSMAIMPHNVEIENEK